MTSMLLILSLLLHAITLMVIFQLFKQIQWLKQEKSSNITDLMETYLDEIKEENRALEETLSQTHSLPEQKTSSDKQPEKSANNESSYVPKTDHVTDESELSREAQILQLHKKGLPVEEIARQLNCGKTEADLIIKLKN